MLGLKLIHVNKGGGGGGGAGIFQHQQQKCSAFYTTVGASGSYCDSFCVFDRHECFYWWQRRHCDDWVSFSTETDMFFFLFTAANDKRYLTLYKLVISTHITIFIIIIIINKLYATVSDVADENIDAVGNLHK